MCDFIQDTNLTNISKSIPNEIHINEGKHILITYLAIISSTGSLGNCLLFGYLLKKKQSTHRILLLGLAAFDLLVCGVTVPFEIFDLEYQYNFYSDVACKLFRSLNYLFICTSILMLMSISLDRYLRTCRPLCRQMCTKNAKYIAVINCCVAMMFAWPNLFFYGVRISASASNFTTFDCTSADEFELTVYTRVYSVILGALFLTFFVLLILCYSRIGVHVFSHIKYRNYFINMQNKENKQNNEHGITLGIRSNHIISSKITKISCIISIVFVLSYSPILTLSILEALLGRYILQQYFVKAFILEIVERFYILNHMANPFIYVFVDKKFRKMLKNIIGCICF